MKTGFAGCFLAALLGALAGCATAPGLQRSLGTSPRGWSIVYRPVLHPEKPPQHWDKMWAEWTDSARAVREGGIAGVTFFANGFTMQVWKGGRRVPLTLYTYQLAKPEIVVEQDPRGTYHIGVSEDVQFHNRTFSRAGNMADYLFLVQDRIRKVIADSEAGLAEFKPVAERYRALAAKPPLPEELRKLVVQAEALREEKKYDSAIELYQKVVAADPVVYPDAYYNMALLAEQGNRIINAIYFMKTYLLLRPDSPDARAAQDKIYAWELKIGR